MKTVFNLLIKGFIFLFITVFLFKQCREAENGLSTEDFLIPPTENRPMALWTWMNGYVDRDKMVYELEEMKDKGMRGAVIWDIGALVDPEGIVPAGPAFLGPESLETIAMALETTKRLGLDLGTSVASSWNSGGPWIDPSLASMELLSTREMVTGPSDQKITIGTPRSNRGEAEVFSLITSIAIPYTGKREIDYAAGSVINLDAFTTDDSYIEWDVPEGNWEVLSFFMCNTMQELVVPSPNSSGLIIDHLSKEATKTHFDNLLSRLDKISTPDNQLTFLFIDSYEVWMMTDWTPSLVEEFESRYGYDPLPFLPLLKGYESKDINIAKRFRGDYRRLVSDLMIENHYGLASQIAGEHGMQVLTEGGHGGNPRVDPLKAMGNSHIPMGEFWNRQRHWVTKEAASAANIYGKKVVASESLTGWNHWQHGPTDFKQLCDVAFCDGLNMVVFHTFPHNPEIAGKPGFVYHAGEHVNVNATWWDMSGPFMDYLSRTSYMLRQGNFVADILLYYGDDAPNLVPPRRLDPNYTPDMQGLFPTWFYDDTKCVHCGRTKTINPGNIKQGYEYDYINAEIITTTLRSENGKLVLPHGQSYRVIMIPDRKEISLEVLKSLEKLVYDGAVIIGPKPERSTSLKNYPECDLEVKVLADKIWGDCDGKTILSNNYGKGTVYWGKTLNQVLDILAVRPDFQVTGIDNCERQIDFMHRQTETEDIYFVTNTSFSEHHFTAVFRVDGNRVPEIWDPETGLIQSEVEYSKVDGGISMEFSMDPLVSRFVVFTGKPKGKNDPDLSYDLQFGLHRKETSAPPIDLSASWQVGFDPAWGGPEQYHMQELKCWTDSDVEGVRYYSGTATYTREFIVEADVLSEGAQAFVVFEDIQNMARVFVNGQDCGIVWIPPYKANITPYLKAGNNQITVEVVNVWNNRIVGDLRNPDQKQYTNTNVKTSRFSANQPLTRSGLLGRAEVVFVF